MDTAVISSTASAGPRRLSPLQRLSGFYHLAKRQAWDIDDLPWDRLPPVPGAEHERWRLLWASIVQQQLQADRIAIEAATRLCLQVPDAEARCTTPPWSRTKLATWRAGTGSRSASGTNAVRYGTMRENVLAVTAVLPDGRVIRTARRARKSAAGYDLTRLLVGSEGTLGIITEVTLRLYPLPEAISAAVVSFAEIEGAVSAVIATIRTGIPIARIELLDEVQMRAVNRYSGLDYLERPTLFLEFHGTISAVREQAEQVGAIAGSFGGSDFQWATGSEERRRLWQARHGLLQEQEDGAARFCEAATAELQQAVTPEQILSYQQYGHPQASWYGLARYWHKR